MAAGTIGLDVGGTKCWAVVAHDTDSVLGDPLEESRLAVQQGWDGLSETLRRSVVDALDAAARRSVQARAVGVGLPGLVDSDGVLHFAPHLPGVEGFPARAQLESEFGLPVAVDNDAALAASAEYAALAASGAGAPPRRLLMVTFGTGIGGGFVRDGEIERGAHGFAGEIGHMVVERDGLSCSCGLRGCWETRASGGALGTLGRLRAAAGQAPGIAALVDGDASRVRGDHVTAAARAGDPDAQSLLAEFADSVAIGLANLTNVWDPDYIVLGGGLADVADLWLEQVRRRYRANIDGADYRPRVPIELARLGSRAGAWGAVLAARARLART